MSGHRISRLFLKVGDTEIQAPTVEEARALAEISQTVPRDIRLKLAVPHVTDMEIKARKKLPGGLLELGVLEAVFGQLKIARKS